ncbi:MAG: cytochrome b [Zetaproteobacteria bacterium]|nr:cytochrome b [Zetaproteobacteria bacterium]
MSWKNTQSSFGMVTKILHWVLAIGVFVEFGLILYRDYFLEPKAALVPFLIGGVHKPLGVTLFFLACLAYAWRLRNTRPKFDTQMSALETRVAAVVHTSLYGYLICMPLTGWLMSSFSAKSVDMFGLFVMPAHLLEAQKETAEWFHACHHYLAYLGFALVFMHLAGIAKQTFLRQEAVVARMLPWEESPSRLRTVRSDLRSGVVIRETSRS